MLRIHGNFTTELRFKAILASNTSSICTTTARQNAVALLRSDYLIPADLMHGSRGLWQRCWERPEASRSKESGATGEIDGDKDPETNP